MKTQVMVGDCRLLLKQLADQSVHTCVTSPPYFGLRDYGMDNQIGLEQTPDAFVAELVTVFKEVRRVLRDDGTLWLNLGDSYASYRDGKATPDTTRGDSEGTLVPKGSAKNRMATTFANSFIKHKDLIGIPWRVAFALQADGWYLRQDIIWNKPNPMPESVTDRCTKAHEYIFLLSKSPKYYFDHEAIKEDAVGGNKGASASFKRTGSKRGIADVCHASPMPTHRPDRPDVRYDGELRNRRSVWSVATKPFRGAHFATFPPDLIEPCILAGCPEGGMVLDPFGGAGTTGLVANRNNRNAILCELNPNYLEIFENRMADEAPLFNSIVSC
jgi:DNA modification methylase